VDLEGEQSELVKTSSEINNGSLIKMGFTTIEGIWVSKEGEAGSSSGAHAGEDNEGEVAATGSEYADAHEAGPSNVNMEERITSMSPFERLVVNRLDNFAHEQRAHHNFVWPSFKVWMSRSKLCRISYLNCSMNKKSEGNLKLSFYFCFV